MKRKRSDIEDELEQANATLRKQIAARDEKIQRLEHQLHSQNSHPGGESFLDSGATPHLLHRALERVNTTSGTFTKLLMQALKNSGVDCTAVAKSTLARSVVFERDAHTKFWYQALVCKALFTDFENESLGVDGNAAENLDPEQLPKENFQRYKELIAVENPEGLVFEDAPDNDFRRLCNKKRKDLVAALSQQIGTPGSESTFSEVFESQVASSFVKLVLSVFLVHKLAFAFRPIARIFRVRDGMRFSDCYMEPVVASADEDDDDPIAFSVGFMVIPGFHVNRIVLRSRVYTGKDRTE